MKEFVLVSGADSIAIWIIAALVMIVFDILSGWVKGVSTHSFETRIMREGLWHKVGSVMAIMLFVGIDVFQIYIDLASAIGFNIKVTPPICIYIILMELMSIIENISVINPEIMPAKIISILGIKDQIEKFKGDKS